MVKEVRMLRQQCVRGFLAMVLVAGIALAGSSIQTDWTGGPGVTGPVSSFGTAFKSSDSVVYAASGMILPTTQMSGQSVITNWIEHVVEDGTGNEGHGALRPADIDGDGDFDLAGAIRGLNVIRLYRNDLIETGVDTFVPQTDLSVKVEGRCGFWVGDLNDDGRPDLVVPGADSIHWFRNDGEWNFTKFFVGLTLSTSNLLYCDVGDVDNDSDMDIVFGMGPLQLWRNNGDMTFARESIAPGRRWRIVLADLNNDDYLDILQADQVYLNPGPGNPGVFPHVPDWEAGFGDGDVDGIWVADFNNDNSRDLLLCRQRSSQGDEEGIYWYENDGTGRGFVQHVIIQGSGARDYGDAVIAGDQDLDGRADVVCGHRRIGYFHQYPIGTFTEVVVDDDFSGCHWVEVENLGRQPGGTKFTKDIMASGNNRFHWWENGLDTTFSRNGWLTSSVLDAGSPSGWQWFVWDATRPTGTELDFYVRTGTTAGQCTLNIWQGPFSVTTGIEVDSVDIGPYTTPGDRYFQYRVFMAGYNDEKPYRAPVVYEVKVMFDSNIHDVGAVSITVPNGRYSAGEEITPEAVWHNYGNVVAGFEAWMILEDPTSDGRVYSKKVDIAGLAPDQDTVVDSFDSYTLLTEGIWSVRCSTYMAGDMDKANDTIDGHFIVSSHPDIGVDYILAPTGGVDTNTTVVPKAKVSNYGDINVPFTAWFVMYNPDIVEVYREVLDVTGLPVGADTTLIFPSYNVGMDIGEWTTWCFVEVPGDVRPGNNCVVDSFRVEALPPWPYGWEEVTSMPLFPSIKPVKRGGWLTIDGGGTIYGAKGYKTQDFYCHSPLSNNWVTLETIPVNEEGRNKPPSKGCKGVSDGKDYIYMTKGNNTLGFWRYDITGDTWERMANVPEGPRRKKVKGGTDLVYVEKGDTGYVYLLKGYKTEFYRYNVLTRQWETLPDAPTGRRGKWGRGSWLVCDHDQTLYAHKAKYHELWKFDLAGDTWYNHDALTGMPFFGMQGGRLRKKKSKDGGSADWYSGEIYALKGGNSQQFFVYTPSIDDWTELDPVPLEGTGGRKRVKYGADFVTYDYGAFYALKGNKTREFWRYRMWPKSLVRPMRSGVMARGGFQISDFRFQISPNPLTRGFAVLRYSLPKAGLANLEVFDVVGQVVKMETIFLSRNGTAVLNMRNLSVGVYLVRIKADGFAVSRKVVVR